MLGGIGTAGAIPAVAAGTATIWAGAAMAAVAEFAAGTWGNAVTVGPTAAGARSLVPE